MTETELHHDVLIVGAGPTGLTLGIELARRSIPFLLIDRDLTPPTTSRAIGMQTRTVEMLALMGVPRSTLQPSLQPRAACLHEGNETLACLAFDPPGTGGVTLTVIDETDTERVLQDRLEALGGGVQRGCELLTFRLAENGVVATIRDVGGEREVHARYLVGADGAHSTVRRVAEIPFLGSAYQEQFILADLDLDWALPHDEAHIWIGGRELVAVLPLPAADRYRVIMPLAPHVVLPASPTEAEVGEMVVRLLRERTGMSLKVRGEPVWASAFHIARRQAARYQDGPVFLAGDAAHVHSPVGGQGMNTGIQDACNLGWKLALAVRGQAAPGLLATYQAERVPVAHRLLRNTDLATRVVLSQNDLMREVRRHIIPRLATVSRVRERLLPLIGQLEVGYRRSFLAVSASAGRGRRAGIQPGDRVPDMPLRDSEGATRRLEDLMSRGWLLLLVPGAGAAEDDVPAALTLASLCRDTVGDAVHPVLVLPEPGPSAPGVTTLLDADGELARRFGAAGGMAVLIRPDAYLGYRGSLEDGGSLVSYLARVFAMRMVA